MDTTRRAFLKLSTAALTAAALARPAAIAQAAQPADAAYGGLTLGIQSYSLRDRSFEKMLEALRDELELHTVELFPNHLAGISPKEAADKLASYDVKAISYGVIGFTSDDARNRQLFDLAKTLGLSNLSCDPDDNDETFQSLEKLTEEFGITVAIHPHGPGHRWAQKAQLEHAFKGRSTRVGFCADTGHLIRAGEDPVALMKLFKDRLHAVHLKDFKKLDGDNKWLDVPAGDATLDVNGVVKFLLQQSFKGGVFVEFEGKSPVDAIKTALTRVAAAVQSARG